VWVEYQVQVENAADFPGAIIVLWPHNSDRLRDWRAGHRFVGPLRGPRQVKHGDAQPRLYALPANAFRLVTKGRSGWESATALTATAIEPLTQWNGAETSRFFAKDLQVIRPDMDFVPTLTAWAGSGVTAIRDVVRIRAITGSVMKVSLKREFAYDEGPNVVVECGKIGGCPASAPSPRTGQQSGSTANLPLELRETSPASSGREPQDVDRAGDTLTATPPPVEPRTGTRARGERAAATSAPSEGAKGTFAESRRRFGMAGIATGATALLAGLGLVVWLLQARNRRRRARTGLPEETSTTSRKPRESRAAEDSLDA